MTSNNMMSIKDYFERRSDRRKRRKSNAAFNAKMSGKPIQPDKSVLIEQLDHLTSLVVFKRDRKLFGGLCLVCMAKQRLGLLDREPEPIQCAYHILPRGDGFVHWDPRNIIGACFRCNNGELWSRAKASLRERYRRIHIAIIGAAILSDLERLASMTSHYSAADLKEMCEQRKAILEDR